MKKGWGIKKLRDICHFENGDRGINYPSKTHRVDIGIPFVNAGHLTSNGLDITTMDFISRERYNLLGSGKIKSGDILFCLRGSLGKFANVGELTEGAIASSLVIVRPKAEITVGFLMAYFESATCANMIDEYRNGAAQPNLSANNLKDFIIALPPLPEQQSIVSILDEAFETIAQAKANAKQNLKNARELFESYLQSAFTDKGDGWEEKKLSIVCEIKPQKKEAREKLKEIDLVSFLPMEDLGVLNKGINAVKERQLKDVGGSYTYFGNDDILLAKVTPCFENGKIGLARNLTNGVGFGSSEYIVFRSKGGVIPFYLYYFLSREQLRIEGKKFMTGAVGLKRVSKDWIENYKIPYPKSIIEQKIIVQKLDTLSAQTKKLEAIYQQKIADLDELKKSLLHKAFNGELKTTELVEA